MKTALKRLLSLAIISAIVLSVAIPAFAAEKATYKHYDSVFSIGDSNAMGFGLSGYKGNVGNGEWQDFTYLHGVIGSFPNLVAEALGVARENHTTLSYPALRTVDALYLLNDDVTEDDFFTGYSIRPNSGYLRQAILDSGGTLESDTSTNHTIGAYFSDALKANDAKGKQLIIVYLGISEIMFSSAMKLLDDIGEISASTIMTIVQKFITNIYDGYNEFEMNTDKLLKYLKAQAPGSDIVIVSAFNPVKDVTLDGEGYAPILEAVSLLTDKMNKYNKTLAEKYDATYVDITNVETYALDKDLSIFTLLGLDEYTQETVYHATPEGFKYIARQILRHLEAKPESATKDIKLDVGSISEISSVSVNSIPVTGYTFDADTHTLTIKSLTVLPKTVTVTEERENGDIYLVKYRLAWNGNGYDTVRLFATRSLNRTIKNFFSRPYSLIKNILNLLG